MRGLKMLSGASLIEAIVASVVFLTVFAVSLETVSRLTAGPGDGYDCAEADCQAALLLRRYRDGGLDGEIVRREFRWGTVTLRSAPYRDCPSLNEVTVTIEIECIRRPIVCKHLVEPCETSSGDE